MTLLNKDVRSAQDLLLQQGERRARRSSCTACRTTAAIHRRRGRPQKCRQFYQYLLSTRRGEQAARLKEGDHICASRAAGDSGERHQEAQHQPPSLPEGSAIALTSTRLHDRAGEFSTWCTRSTRTSRAIAYRKAVELIAFPGQSSCRRRGAKQVDLAINHHQGETAHRDLGRARLAPVWVRRGRWSRNSTTPGVLAPARAPLREESPQYDEAERYWVKAQATILAVEISRETILAVEISREANQ